jgi:hypothetical protein
MRMGEKGHCYACDAELRPEFPIIDGHTRRMTEDPDFQQYDNALPITFDGGYGMFHDDMEAGCRYQVIICHECAHKLCDQVEWIKRLIDPHSSHAHHIDWKAAHPEHYGWDYDLKEDS